MSYSDLCNNSSQKDENTEEADYKKKPECCASQGSSASTSPQHSAEFEGRPRLDTTTVYKKHIGAQRLLDLESNGENCSSVRLSYLDLKHFTTGFKGFLADEVAMESFLKMLLDHLKEIEESLPWDSRHMSQEELALLDGLNLPVNRDGFGSRVQLFSKYLSEAQWRYKVVMSNRNAGKLFPWPY